MTHADNNYRKAKRGEIKCEDCAHVIAPPLPGCRHRCAVYSYSYVIRKRNTCDKAARPEGDC